MPKHITSIRPESRAFEGLMNMRNPMLILIIILLCACGQDEPPERQQQKSFGGQLGDSYKGMLDTASQGARDAGEQMQRTDRAVRDR